MWLTVKPGEANSVWTIFFASSKQISTLFVWTSLDARFAGVVPLDPSIDLIAASFPCRNRSSSFHHHWLFSNRSSCWRYAFSRNSFWSSFCNGNTHFAEFHLKFLTQNSLTGCRVNSSHTNKCAKCLAAAHQNHIRNFRDIFIRFPQQKNKLSRR